MSDKMDVVLLGTGSPLPSPTRCGGGQVIISGETRLLIDCGWGVARRLVAAGVPPPLIDVVCFTHMHSDHITDLPDFLIMRWTGGATKPLQVYGPEGTREMVDGFRAGLAPDIRFRFAHHGEKLSREGIECVVHEVPATPHVSHAVSVGDLNVGAFEVDHRPVVPALGFRVERGERSVVFSGDTKACPSLVEASRGADMLVSEALHLGMMQDRLTALRVNNERMAEILTEACDYHAPTLDVAAMARDAGVKQLVLSHLIPPIPDEGPLVERFAEGMNEIYGGPITVAKDLQRFTIGD